MIGMMWFGAITFFVITECLVFFAMHERLSSLSQGRLWSLPFMVSVPLIYGAGFTRMIRRNLRGNDCRDLIAKTLFGIATLECLLYAIMCGISTFIL